MKTTVAVGVLAFLAGTLATFLYLAAETRAYERQVRQALDSVEVLAPLVAQERTRADVATAFADSMRSVSRPLPSVDSILVHVPDRQQVKALVGVIALMDSALADSGEALDSLRSAVTALARVDTLQTTIIDTILVPTLEDRPSAAVKFSWRPSVGGEVFASYEAPVSSLAGGSLCAGAGPTVGLWQVKARVYGAACSTSDVFQGLNQPQVEFRIGVTASISF